MRTVAVVPVKSFDAAKQRLSPRLGGGSRHLLAQAMMADVLAALRRVRRLDAVAVVTDDHEIEAMLRGDPVTVLRDDQRDGQSAAAMIGIRHAIADGYRRVLLVPGDTPLIDAGEVDRLLDANRTGRADLIIVPDRHRQGTNALVISPPDAFEPRFGPESLERHLEAARTAELPHRVEDVESLMHDVDTVEDLAALAAELEVHRGVAPRTRGRSASSTGSTSSPAPPAPARGRSKRRARPPPIPGARSGGPSARARRRTSTLPGPEPLTLGFTALRRLPEVEPGDDLGMLLAEAAPADLADADVLVVAHKVVSKAEGRTRRLADVAPTGRARSIAARHDRDARLVQVVLDESREVLRAERGVIVSVTAHGLVCANAGVDRSNAAPGEVVLLPLDPDASARSLRARIGALRGVRPALVVADTFGRAWRLGQVDVAVGAAGLRPLDDWRGRRDAVGRELTATRIAVADALAGAAELVRAKDSSEPAVLARGLSRHVTEEDGPGAAALRRPAEEDLFR